MIMTTIMNLVTLLRRIYMYSREGGYFGNEEPEVINEDDDEG